MKLDWGYRMADLKTELLGIELDNPTVMASGVLGISRSSLKTVAEGGAGAVTTKSITREPREGHSNPVLISFEAGLMNAMGYPNPGAEAAKEEFKELKEIGVPVIGSVTGTEAGDFVETLKILKDCPFQAIEIPLSCPHTPGYGTMAGQGTPEKTREITEKVVETTELPVIVKLSPNISRLGEVAKAAEEAGAEAINMGNVLGPGMVINTKAKRPVLSFGVGGLSGPAIRPVMVRCVYDVYQAVDIPIIGTGGITTGEDAVEMLMAGASAVEMASAIYYRGVDVFRKVSKEIEDFMEEEGYQKIKEMVGVAHG